jgi:hypothetical protein
VPHREGGGLQPGVSSELREQGLDVGADRRRRDSEAPDHRRGVVASHQQLQALPLACGEAACESQSIALESELRLDGRTGGYLDHNFATQDALNGPLQHCDTARFVDVSDCAGAHRLHDAVGIAVGREDQHFGPGCDGNKITNRAQAIAASRKVPVHEANVRLPRTDGGDCVLNGARLDHRPAVAAQHG